MSSPFRISRTTRSVVHDGAVAHIAEIEEADWGVIPPGQPVFVAWAIWHSGNNGSSWRSSGPLYAGRISSNTLIPRVVQDGRTVQAPTGHLVLEPSAGPVWGNLPGCHPHQQQRLAGPLLTFPHRSIYRVYFLLPPPAPRTPRRRKANP